MVSKSVLLSFNFGIMEIDEKPGNYGWKVLLVILVLLALVVFSVQNSTETAIKFWFLERKIPLVFLMVFSFVLGLGFSLLVIWPVSKQSKRKSKLIKELKQRIDLLESRQNTEDEQETPNLP